MKSAAKLVREMDRVQRSETLISMSFSDAYAAFDLVAEAPPGEFGTDSECEAVK